MSKTAGTRTAYDGVAVCAPVTIPYRRYSTNSAHWWIGRALHELVNRAGIHSAFEVAGHCSSPFSGRHPEVAAKRPSKDGTIGGRRPSRLAALAPQGDGPSVKHC